MGPKKAKGSKSKDGTAGSPSKVEKNALIATNEDELRRRVEEAEAQLREEAKIMERMSRDSKSKSDQLAAMDQLLQREKEKHLGIVAILEQEMASQQAQWLHEKQVLHKQLDQLHMHVEAFDVLQETNETLRQRVDTLMGQLQQESASHVQEIHQVRLELFNHKMALEKTFRKTLQELDADYLKKAFNAMSEESKNALVANAKLKDELQLQSIGIDNLMGRLNAQTSEFQQLKMENEILATEKTFQLQEMQQMKSQVLTSRRQLQLHQEATDKELKDKQSATQQQLDQFRAENLHLQKLLDNAQKRSLKWKTRCLDMKQREARRK